MIWKRKLDESRVFVPFFEIKEGKRRAIHSNWGIGPWFDGDEVSNRYEPYLDVTIEELKLIEML